MHMLVNNLISHISLHILLSIVWTIPASQHTSNHHADYTIFMESHHFDLMNEQDWQHFRTSTEDPHFIQKYREQHDDATLRGSFHGHRLLEEAEDVLWEEEMAELNMNADDMWYYDYFWTDDQGQRQILKQIEACSDAIESLQNRRLCVHWHDDEGLKLGMTDNADASLPGNMLKFNDDGDWNRIDMVDNLGKAAARGTIAVRSAFQIGRLGVRSPHFLHILMRVPEPLRCFL